MAETKAVRAAAAEATAEAGRPSVRFRGETFEIPPMSEWPVDAFEAFEDDQLVTAIRAVMGPAGWARFKALSPRPTMADLSALVSEIASAAGLGSAGES